MSFRFGDPGGRMYVTSVIAILQTHWTTVTGASSVVVSGGRFTGSCLRTSGSSYTKILDSQPTYGVAVACKVAALPATNGVILNFLDSGTTQCDLRIDGTGALLVTRNGTVLGTVPGVVTINVWFHVEIKITFHASAGTIYLGVSGVQRLNLTAQNTRNTANSSANTITLTSYTGSTVDFDDVIVYDAQTNDANGFSDITGPIGDCRLTWLLPTAAGSSTQFTPDSGSNFARVNEATPDITSYVDGSVGQVDTYQSADTLASTVKSVALVHYARKTDVGVRGMKPVIRSTGANYTYPTEIALADTYVYYFSSFGQNPNNGSPIPWTPAAVNALEIGQTCSS